MASIMRGDCGHVVGGETGDELLANVQEHAHEVHDMDLIREQILAIAQHE